MNKVDREIARSIRNYPMLYDSRDAVLDHYFITLGSGYEWKKDGTFGSVFEGDNELDRSKEEAVSLRDKSFSDRPETETWEDLQPGVGLIYDKADELALFQTIEPMYFHWYPFFNGPHGPAITEIPENADPEWLEVAIEAGIKYIKAPENPSNHYGSEWWQESKRQMQLIVDHYPEIVEKLERR